MPVTAPDVDDEPAGAVLPTGSPEFAGWYREEHPRLVAVMVRFGAAPEQASDLTAEAFSRALERWERVGAMASPTGWVFQVGMNLLRRQGRRSRLEAALLRRHSPTNLVDGPGGEVWDAVRSLPERQRRAVVLHYLLDLPYADVARAMGVSGGTVGATLHEARKRLAEALREPSFMEAGDA